MTQAIERFDPTSKLITVRGGAQYLEVKWRLAWLRSVEPDAIIETECLLHTDKIATFKARVATQGGGVGSGHGSETPGDFGDYYEKAETKALGRALASLGYGTQFCDDFDFGSADGHVVDAPVGGSGGYQQQAQQQRPQQQRPQQQQTQQSGQVGVAPENMGAPASEKQIGFIRKLVEERGFSEEVVNSYIAEKTGDSSAHMGSMPRGFASQFIDSVKSDQFAQWHERALSSMPPPSQAFSDVDLEDVPF